MSNIAEGFDRNGNREFMQFCYIAKASAAEFRSQLYTTYDIGYLNETDFLKLKSPKSKLLKKIGANIKKDKEQLKEKEKEKIQIKNIKNTKLFAYVDADFAGDMVTRKSTTGMIICLNEMPIYWKSKLQTSVASRTVEAEIIALYELTQEILYYRDILKNIGFEQDTIDVFDSMNSIRKYSTMKHKFSFILIVLAFFTTTLFAIYSSASALESNLRVEYSWLSELR